MEQYKLHMHLKISAQDVKKFWKWESFCKYLLHENDSNLELSAANIWTGLPSCEEDERQLQNNRSNHHNTKMIGFYSTSAASVHCHWQLRNGSVHHELIRPNHYRPRNVINCCSTAGCRTRDYYYQVLGVTVHSTPQEIKEAYRKLQKQHHPDITGYKVHQFPSASFYLLFSSFPFFYLQFKVQRRNSICCCYAVRLEYQFYSIACCLDLTLKFWYLNVQGHEHTLLLNEAYKVLARNPSRHVDGKSRAGFGNSYTGDGYSSWNGPVRNQALFVDENKCIGMYLHSRINIPVYRTWLQRLQITRCIIKGCRECVHHAARTFAMDDVLGSAHVEIQFGDLEQQIQVVWFVFWATSLASLIN